MSYDYVSENISLDKYLLSKVLLKLCDYFNTLFKIQLVVMITKRIISICI